MTRRDPWRPLFTCEHCGRDVPPASYKGEPKPRNHCPYCLWSKHIEMGEESGYPPCGAMMRGTDVGNEQVTWRCLGCGYMMRGPTDDYMMRTVRGALGTPAHVTLYPAPGSAADDARSERGIIYGGAS